MAWHTHKKLTLGQSRDWSNPVNSYLTTWLLNITDEVWLRLINLRERLSVGWYTTTMYNILFLNCNLCSTKNDLLYLSEGSLELKQAICCLIVFVVHDQTSQDTNMSSPSAEYVFFFCLYPVWKQPETSTPGSGLDQSKSLFFFWWYITFENISVSRCKKVSVNFTFQSPLLHILWPGINLYEISSWALFKKNHFKTYQLKPFAATLHRGILKSTAA